MCLPPLASSHFFRINNKLVVFCISYCSVQLLNVAALEQAWAAWPLLHTTACWLLMWSAVEIGVAQQKGISQHLWLNSEQWLLLGNKENTIDLEAWCLFGFVIRGKTALNFNVREQKGRGYYWQFFVCWTEEEGPGLCCAGKGRVLRGADGFPTSSLLNSVLAVLPACFPLFSPTSAPSMEREGGGSSLLRRSKIYGMVDLGLWDPGKGQTENGMQGRVCVWGDSKHLAEMEEACGPVWRWQGQQPERETRRISRMVHGAEERQLWDVIWSCYFQSKLASVLLTARISVIIWTTSTNSSIFFSPLNKGKHYKEVAIKMNCEVLSVACWAKSRELAELAVW